MQQSAQGVMQSVSGEVSGRVDGVLRLLEGMAADERFADTSKPIFDRAIQAETYKESYNLYMIAITDKDVNVSSSDETAPPVKPYNLGYRKYMQKLYATGKHQITDAIIADSDKETMNYTIAVPILKNGKVEGSIFGSIYFQDIQDTLIRESKEKGRVFYLFGEDNTLMHGGDEEIFGKSFFEATSTDRFLDCKREIVNSNMLQGKSGNCWQIGRKGISYFTYQKVEPTNWTILYEIQFMSIFEKLIPMLLVKIGFYILLCVSVYFMGKRYIERHFSQVSHLLTRMATIQKELFQLEKPDYENLIELTQQGLTDQLTGLNTRAVLFQKMSHFAEMNNTYGAVAFLDLDDLKYVNDNFGHEGGDGALICIAQALKEYEQKYNGIAARYGGDEFIFTFNANNEKEATDIIESLCRRLDTTVTTKDYTFNIHGSIGAAFYPEHGQTPEELICKADLALYAAKQKGKNQCAFYADNRAISL